MNEDGSDWKKLFEFEGHHACGSPTVSPDGKLLAFDSWIGANLGGSALYVMDINGGEPRQIWKNEDFWRKRWLSGAVSSDACHSAKAQMLPGEITIPMVSQCGSRELA